MRKYYLMFVASLAVSAVSAQTFSDDFESYANGDYIAQASEDWETWGDKPGSNEDVKVVNTEARSGSQSLYLSSTDGGPEDLVLPFGGTHTIGSLELKMAIQVETGKGSYFNIQGDEKAGETWVLNFQSGASGEFELYNDQEVLVRGNMNNGEWIEMKLVADLSYNRWSFFMDNEMIVSWNNAVNSIGGLNLYPVNNMDENAGAGYWVDDVSYTYAAFEPSGLNAALTKISYEGVRLEGSELVVSADVRNLGADEISSVELEYSYQGAKASQTFTGLSLTSANTATLNFDAPITLGADAAELNVEIVKVDAKSDDDNVSDDRLSAQLSPIVPGANRMVILEEGTGTWCGWCPRGAVSLEQLEEKYGDYFQGIAIHSGDPMSAQPYTQQFVDAYVPGFPSGQLNRDQTLSMNPGASESAFLEALLVPAVTSMDVGAELTDGNQLTVSVTYTFSEAVNEQFRVACALVENGVTGTDPGYAQSNYYANNANGEMFGWENKPSTVPASDMVYHDVARAISPSFRGSDALPAAMSAGESHTFQFTFEIAKDWNVEEMRIVPLCFKADNSIENGASFVFEEALEIDLQEGVVISGVTEFPASSTLQVYPNPATAQITVINEEQGLLEVYNMAGGLVLSHSLTTAKETVDVETLETGMYTLRFTSTQGVSNSSLVVK